MPSCFVTFETEGAGGFFVPSQFSTGVMVHIVEPRQELNHFGESGLVLFKELFGFSGSISGNQSLHCLYWWALSSLVQSALHIIFVDSLMAETASSTHPICDFLVF